MNNTQPNTDFLFWIIWLAMLIGIGIIQFLIGGGLPSGTNQGSPNQGLVLISASSTIIATFIRWIILPKLTDKQATFIAMIFGLALAEGTIITQLFLIGNQYPETQSFLLTLGILGMLQFVPTYIKKFNPNPPS